MSISRLQNDQENERRRAEEKEIDELRAENERLRKLLGGVVHAADELLAGGEAAIRHAEQCTECGLGGVGPLRDALALARAASPSEGDG